MSIHEDVPGTLNAVLLVGGQGTRLRSIVADRQKILAEVVGRPFVTYLFDQLAAAGFKRVIQCTGYHAKQVENMLGSFYGSLRLEYSSEEQPLGTAGALRLALPHITSEHVLVMNGDSFCEVKLIDFWQFHQVHHAEATLCLTLLENTSRYGKVDTDKVGHIIRFNEKGTSQGKGWINAGIYLIHTESLAEIPPNRPVSLEREVFPTWIERNFFGFPSYGRFIDIGTSESYAAAEHFFSRGYNQ